MRELVQPRLDRARLQRTVQVVSQATLDGMLPPAMQMAMTALGRGDFRSTISGLAARVTALPDEDLCRALAIARREIAFIEGTVDVPPSLDQEDLRVLRRLRTLLAEVWQT